MDDKKESVLLIGINYEHGVTFSRKVTREEYEGYVGDVNELLAEKIQLDCEDIHEVLVVYEDLSLDQYTEE